MRDNKKMSKTVNIINIDDTIKKIISHDKEKLLFYVLRTIEYIKIIKSYTSSGKIVFGTTGVQSIDHNLILQDALLKYKLIAREYIDLPVNIILPDDKKIGQKSNSLICEDCNIPIRTDDLNNMCCRGCGRSYNAFLDKSFNDHTRVNIIKPVHNREAQFIIHINRKQGTHPVENGEGILQTIRNACKEKHININYITAKTIHTLLNEYKLTNNYGDIPWIIWQLRGIAPLNLEPIKPKLIELHRQFSAKYYSLKTQTKKNYPTNDYLLARFILLINDPQCTITISELESTLAFDRLCEYELIMENFCKHYKLTYKKLW